MQLLPFSPALFALLHSQACKDTAQKLNSLWRGKKYAPLLQQPFSEAAISSLPKGIKLLQRSTDSLQMLAAAVQHCQPDSNRHPAPDAAAQQAFLQDLQQHNPAQLAAELLVWLQGWPDLPCSLLSAGRQDANSRVQAAAEQMWKGATRLLTVLLDMAGWWAEVVAGSQLLAEADSCTPNPSLDLLEQLVGPCCTTGAPSVLSLPLMCCFSMHEVCQLLN
jgi:hypothetical protein